MYAYKSFFLHSKDALRILLTFLCQFIAEPNQSVCVCVYIIRIWYNQKHGPPQNCVKFALADLLQFGHKW